MRPYARRSVNALDTDGLFDKHSCCFKVIKMVRLGSLRYFQGFTDKELYEMLEYPYRITHDRFVFVYVNEQVLQNASGVTVYNKVKSLLHKAIFYAMHHDCGGSFEDDELGQLPFSFEVSEHQPKAIRPETILFTHSGEDDIDGLLDEYCLKFEHIPIKTPVVYEGIDEIAYADYVRAKRRVFGDDCSVGMATVITGVRSDLLKLVKKIEVPCIAESLRSVLLP